MCDVCNESLLSVKETLWNSVFFFPFNLQLLMCGTGDINVQDFKAHAVIVGGSWHFREKVSQECFALFYLSSGCLSMLILGCYR